MPITLPKPDPINPELLIEELQTAGYTTIQFSGNNVIVHDIGAIESEVQAVLTAHVHTGKTDEQLAEEVEAGAQSQASSIPGWATWDEATALAWFDTNIGDNLPVANLSEANAVLSDMATLQRNLVRLVIALRNKNFPNLQE